MATKTTYEVEGYGTFTSYDSVHAEVAEWPDTPALVLYIAEKTGRDIDAVVRSIEWPDMVHVVAAYESGLV